MPWQVSLLFISLVAVVAVFGVVAVAIITPIVIATDVSEGVND